MYISFHLEITPRDCPNLIVPDSVRVAYRVLFTGHKKADLSCRGEFDEFPSDIDPSPQYCIDGHWTHQIQGYDIPSCESKC